MSALPVQAPTKFPTLVVVNLSAAKALGFQLPATFLRCDEVIE
jgi:hypothetical protein